MNSTPEGYKQLLVEEEGCGNPTVVFYRINLLGEIVPRFPFGIRLNATRLHYYNKVLMEHVADLAEQKENKHET